MPFMPAGHSTRELALARAIETELGSRELHVFWSEHPPPLPAPRVAPLAAVGAIAAAVVVADALIDALGGMARRATRG